MQLELPTSTYFFPTNVKKKLGTKNYVEVVGDVYPPPSFPPSQTIRLVAGGGRDEPEPRVGDTREVRSVRWYTSPEGFRPTASCGGEL